MEVSMPDIKEMVENAVKIKILSTDFNAPRMTKEEYLEEQKENERFFADVLFCGLLSFPAIGVCAYFGFFKTAACIFVFDMIYFLRSASKSHKPKTPEELAAEMKAGEEALEAFKASWKRNILHVIFLLAGLAFAGYVLYLYALSKE